MISIKNIYYAIYLFRFTFHNKPKPQVPEILRLNLLYRISQACIRATVILFIIKLCVNEYLYIGTVCVKVAFQRRSYINDLQANYLIS